MLKHGKYSALLLSRYFPKLKRKGKAERVNLDIFVHSRSYSGPGKRFSFFLSVEEKEERNLWDQDNLFSFPDVTFRILSIKRREREFAGRHGKKATHAASSSVSSSEPLVPRAQGTTVKRAKRLRGRECFACVRPDSSPIVSLG